MVSDRLLVLISAVGAACFALCMAVSIALYPGGTWFNRRAEGHSFWQNFLCDLMQTRALNGEEAAAGSVFARVGTVVILIALAAFFAQIARFEEPVSRWGRLARGAGVMACVLGFAVPLVPSDLFRDAHVVAVVCAFIPSLVALIAASVVCFRAPGVPRWLVALAWLTLGAGSLDGILYCLAYAQSYDLIPPFQRWLLNRSLPVFQRVATLGLLGWLAAVGVHTTVSSRRRRGD